MVGALEAQADTKRGHRAERVGKVYCLLMYLSTRLSLGVRILRKSGLSCRAHLVVCVRLLELLELLVGDASVVIGVEVLDVEIDRAVEVLDGLLEIADARTYDGPVVVKLSVVVLVLDGLVDEPPSRWSCCLASSGTCSCGNSRASRPGGSRWPSRTSPWPSGTPVA